MSGEDAPDPIPPRATGAALVGLCILGLLVAAIAAPALGVDVGAPDAPEGDDGSGGDAGGSDGSGDPDDVDGPGIVDLLEWLLPDGGPGDGRSGAPECTVSVAPQPTPGRVVTVTVTRGGRPVEGALVRFEGDAVGRTDATGDVRGEVPYVRNLEVSATLPGDVSCATTTTTGAVVPAPAGAAVASGVAPPERVAAVAGPNVSETYDVDGDVRIDVDGTPDPGTTVTLAASVEGIPMRSATVAVNGRTVGTTGDHGRYDLRVPDDGTESLRIRVERGEFAGTRTVPVRLLRAHVRPAGPLGPLALPGTRAGVRSTVADEPVGDAVVTLDGRRLGTTDAEGRLDFDLPADPRATLTVRAEGQAATVDLWLHYAGTVAVLAAVLSGLAGVAALASGRVPRPRRLGDRVARLLDRLATRLVALALWTAAGLERGLAWLVARALAAAAAVKRAARRAREDLPVALAAFRRWLTAHLRRVPVVLRAALARVGRVPWLLWAWAFGTAGSDGTGAGTVGESGTGDALPNPGARPFDLRTAWRTVARAVAPAAWRTRTPREVVRLAVERGLPRGPVERLAAVFEEVEYGGRPLSPDRREQARAAFDAWLAHVRGTDGEEDG